LASGCSPGEAHGPPALQGELAAHNGKGAKKPGVAEREANMFLRADPKPYAGWARRGAIAGLALAGMVMGHATAAPNEDAVKAGLEIWKSSGCADCHGPFADGDKQRDEMPTGANLRGSRLDGAALKQTISCGRPDTGMPSFDGGAYLIRPCYGRALGDAPDNLYPTPRTLTPEQIDSVITYLQAHVLGRRQITHEDCLYYYYDAPSSWCDDK
jgi:mono/diheme cytochrome c family protein